MGYPQPPVTHRMTRQLDARLGAYFAPPAGGDLRF